MQLAMSTRYIKSCYVDMQGFTCCLKISNSIFTNIPKATQSDENTKSSKPTQLSWQRTCPCRILVVPSTRLGSDKYKFGKSLVWLDRVLNCCLPHEKPMLLSIQPPHPMTVHQYASMRVYWCTRVTDTGAAVFAHVPILTPGHIWAGLRMRNNAGKMPIQVYSCKVLELSRLPDDITLPTPTCGSLPEGRWGDGSVG